MLTAYILFECYSHLSIYRATLKTLPTQKKGGEKPEYMHSGYEIVHTSSQERTRHLGGVK